MKIEDIPVQGYHRVAKATDEASGLCAFIAVHDVTLGPAVGGIRMWKYGSEQEAQTDALRLAEGMTYKSAVADTGLGGGKSVIFGDSRKDKSKALLHAFGEALNAFDGAYYAAEDVGMSVADVVTINETSKYVAGLPVAVGGSGDPSPYTARGTFVGIQACVESVYGSADLAGRRVLVQGIGSVGSDLVRFLAKAGAEVLVADLHQDQVAALTAETGATAVDPHAVIGMECDVFAPCALGGILNDQSIPQLKCKIVAGAANNQLLEARHGRVLKDRGIVYAPDFVINAAGIIAVGVSLRKEGWDEQVALERTDNVRRAVSTILEMAQDRDIPTSEAALILARERIAAARKPF